MWSTIATVGLLLPALAYSQATSFPVPTGRPVPGNYDGFLRPQVHFSPPRGFMNDPNGMFYLDGLWHLYYQYNPADLVAGSPHWGHATSKDLYTWENQKIALFPANESSFVFSGSCVIDPDNTSGFFPNQKNGIVAIYTLATYEPIELQSQALAISHDGGYTFKKYKGNPVLDVGSSQFRDPKVIWYKDHWVMAISFASDFTVGFYTSKNLIDWKFGSNFTHYGLLGIQYECPNLVEMPLEGRDETIWVLQVSINPGAPLGGSIAQYFPGTFDGYTFKTVDNAARIADFAKDNYAGQFFYGTQTGQDVVSMAWASNWQYTNFLPTGVEGWRSVMSAPRNNSIAPIGGVIGHPNLDYVLISKPYDLTPVLGRHLVSKKLSNSSVVLDYADVYSNALYFEMSATKNAQLGTFNVSFSSPVSGEYLTAGTVLGRANPVWINRGGTKGFDNPYFADKFSVNTLGYIRSLSGIIDRSIFEIFVNGGTHSGTSVYFPTQPLTLMYAGAADLPEGASIQLDVWELKSTWKGSSSNDDKDEL